MIKKIRRPEGYRYKASHKFGNSATVELGTFDTKREAIAAIDQCKTHSGVTSRTGVTSTGRGPLSFDVSMARRHGWTGAQIDELMIRIGEQYRLVADRVHRAHPELYARCKSDGTIIYIGPDDSGKAMDMNKKSARKLFEPLAKRSRR